MERVDILRTLVPLRPTFTTMYLLSKITCPQSLSPTFFPFLVRPHYRATYKSVQGGTSHLFEGSQKLIVHKSVPNTARDDTNLNATEDTDLFV